jgi:hypothetical protein
LTARQRGDVKLSSTTLTNDPVPTGFPYFHLTAKAAERSEFVVALRGPLPVSGSAAQRLPLPGQHHLPALLYRVKQLAELVLRLEGGVHPKKAGRRIAPALESKMALLIRTRDTI